MADDTPTGDGGATPAPQQPANNSGQQQGDHGKPAGKPDSGAEPEKTFTQAELDRKIEDRLARERKKFSDYDDVKQRADEAEQARQKMLDDIGKALGLKSDDAPPDPDTLQRTIGDKDARIAALEHDRSTAFVEKEALKAALRVGANPIALTDSRTFMSEAAALDPADDGFHTALEGAVKAALEANPTLAAVPVPAKSPKPDPTQGAGRATPTGAERGISEAMRRYGNRANTPA